MRMIPMDLQDCSILTVAVAGEVTPREIMVACSVKKTLARGVFSTNLIPSIRLHPEETKDLLYLMVYLVETL
jgi:hypothetical protein